MVVQSIYNTNLYQNSGFSLLANQSNINFNSIINLFGSVSGQKSKSNTIFSGNNSGFINLLQNLSKHQSTHSKKPVTVDKTEVTVTPKKCDDSVHGYTALHQSLAWGEEAAQKMWSLYDANKDGILDHDEDAALRATFTQGSVGTWTNMSCKQMIGQSKTPDLFYGNLKNIKSLSNKEDNLYYKAALSSYDNWKGKPGSV